MDQVDLCALLNMFSLGDNYFLAMTTRIFRIKIENISTDLTGVILMRFISS